MLRGLEMLLMERARLTYEAGLLTAAAARHRSFVAVGIHQVSIMMPIHV